MGIFSKSKDKDKEKSSHRSQEEKKNAVSNGQPGERALVIGTSADRDVLFESGKLVLDVIDITGLPVGCAPCLVVSYEHTEQVVPAVKGSTVVFDVTKEDCEVHLQLVNAAETGQAVLGRAALLPAWVPNKPFERTFQLNTPTGHDLRLSISITFRKLENKKLTIDDFQLLKVIGKGSFGKVMQVRKKDTGRVYAMKILNKSDLVARDEVDHTRSERAILAQNSHCPFLVGLKFSFQTPEKVYLVLDYVNGGELFFHLQYEGTFSEERSRFYAAQLVLGLEYLHSKDIIYRDLKPENILVDYMGYIALTDFGLCKEDIRYDETTNTFCGTPEYMAPEVLQEAGHGPAVDWWTIGVLLYEMLAGIPPFYHDNTQAMYQKILFADLVFPESMSPLAKSIITGLLDRNPSRRLGAGPNGAKAVKDHMFFAPINWVDLWHKRILAPWRPTLRNETDTGNFDPTFTEMTPQDSLARGGPIHESEQTQFQGFTYVDGNEYLD